MLDGAQNIVDFESAEYGSVGLSIGRQMSAQLWLVDSRHDEILLSAVGLISLSRASGDDWKRCIGICRREGGDSILIASEGHQTGALREYVVYYSGYPRCSWPLSLSR